MLAIKTVLSTSLGVVQDKSGRVMTCRVLVIDNNLQNKSLPQSYLMTVLQSLTESKNR